MIQLSNDKWNAKIKLKGAELSSLINLETGRELIWQGDSKYWGRQAPILFPSIGGLKNDQYTLDGVLYKMGKHGFCRDAQFTLISSTETSAILQFTQTEETLKQYPYHFAFRVIFELTDNGLINRFEIQNNSEKPLFYCLGGHPAFNLPMENNLQFDDYKIRFENSETAPLYYLENDLLAGKIDNWLNNQNEFNLEVSLFDNDALIFHNLSSKNIFIESNKGESYVKFNMGSFPMVGIWTKEGGAPFLCVEPWYGVDDDINTDGDFTKKWEVQKVEVGSTNSAWFSISGK